MDKNSLSKFALVIVTCIAFLIQFLSNNLTEYFSNFIVGDGRTLIMALDDFSKNLTSISDFHSSKLFFLIYYYPFKYFGIFGIFFINLFFIYLISEVSGVYVVYSLPLLILSACLPSKEIIISCITLYTFLAVLKNINFVLIFGMIVITYYLRDGAAIITFISTFIICIYKYKQRYWLPLILLLITCILIFTFSEIILNNIPGYARNFNTFKSTSKLDCCNAGGYIIRLIGNLSNFALRPQFYDVDGRISVLGVAFFITGFAYLYSFLLAALNLLNSKNYALNCASIFLIASLFVLSINPFVQPRYLLPYILPVLWLSFRYLSLDLLLILLILNIIIVMAGTVFYFFADIAMPPQPIPDFFLFYNL